MAKSEKADLWICYRNYFELLYVAVRNTWPEVYFFQSIRPSSLTTAKKRDSEKCAVDDDLLSIVGPLYPLSFCQTSQCTLQLGQVRNHLCKSSDKQMLSDSYFCSQYGQYPF